MDNHWIGRSAERVGGVDRVTGAQRYAADIRLENVLQVKLVSLDCARARLNAIDKRQAAKIEGVRCILTAGDLPGSPLGPTPRYGPTHADRPVLAVATATGAGMPSAPLPSPDEKFALAMAGRRFESIALKPTRRLALPRPDPAAGLGVSSAWSAMEIGDRGRQ